MAGSVLMQASQELSTSFPSAARAITPPLAAAGASAAQVLSSSYRIADVSIAIVSVLAAFLITNLGALAGHAKGFLALRISIKNLLLMFLFGLVWSGCYRAFGLYQNQNRQLNVETVMRLMAASSAGCSFALFFVITSRAGAFGHGTLLLAWLLSISMAICVRFVLNALHEPGTFGKAPRQVGWIQILLKTLIKSRNSRLPA
jgi:FlaA1/EpsC-like NDP-sugar epimerase